MLHYKIYYSNPASQMLHFELEINTIGHKKISLQLPSWRPGRYSLQNFAKNIHSFQVIDLENRDVPFKKTTKDQWEINTVGCKRISVKYVYHASQMDAGGTWLDTEQLYVNPITCAFQVMEMAEEAYRIELDIPKNYQIASSFKKKGKYLLARDFHELVDTPLLASANLQHKTYKVANCLFYIWILGDCKPDWKKTLSEFKAFTEVQIKAFGGQFPTSEYHFINQILPYSHYHGVEHQHSTVITMGPSEAFHEKTFQDNFLGVSSHELYHTWNVTRLRSSDLVPYKYGEENYTEAGFILEGITTYYGDLMLKRSGVWNEEQYLTELGILLKRHFHNIAHSQYSVTEASFDLWLDGYSRDEPKRMPSIYIKGALCAIMLDLEIRKLTENKKSLDDVMLLMWQQYGVAQSGYKIDNYIAIVEKIAGKKMKTYFKKYVFGTSDFMPKIGKLFEEAGLVIELVPSVQASERLFGFKLDANMKVVTVQPSSPAYHKLTLGDEIIAIENKRASHKNINQLIGTESKLSFHVFRNNLLLTANLKSNDNQYFNDFKVTYLDGNKDTNNELRKLWLN